MSPTLVSNTVLSPSEFTCPHKPPIPQSKLLPGAFECSISLQKGALLAQQASLRREQFLLEQATVVRPINNEGEAPRERSAR